MLALSTDSQDDRQRLLESARQGDAEQVGQLLRFLLAASPHLGRNAVGWAVTAARQPVRRGARTFFEAIATLCSFVANRSENS